MVACPLAAPFPREDCLFVRLLFCRFPLSRPSEEGYVLINRVCDAGRLLRCAVKGPFESGLAADSDASAIRCDGGAMAERASQ